MALRQARPLVAYIVRGLTVRYILLRYQLYTIAIKLSIVLYDPDFRSNEK